MVKLAFVLIIGALILLAALCVGEYQTPGNTERQVKTLQDNMPVKCAGKGCTAQGVVVSGDEPFFSLVGIVILAALFGMFKRSHTTVTLSERYFQYGRMDKSAAERYHLS